MNGDDKVFIQREMDKLGEQMDKFDNKNRVQHKEIMDKIDEWDKTFLSKETFWNLTKILMAALIAYAGALGTLWAYVIKLNGA